MFFFFFNDTATTEIYTLSLHDALPISLKAVSAVCAVGDPVLPVAVPGAAVSPGTSNCSFTNAPAATVIEGDRKSTRLNSSHGYISYAVFCLKKKKTKNDDVLLNST